MAIKKKRCRENNKGGMITSRFVCMVNLNCILAIFPEWGQKVPPEFKNGSILRPRFFEIWNLNKITMKSEHKKWGQKAPPHIINKGFKGKIPC